MTGGRFICLIATDSKYDKLYVPASYDKCTPPLLIWFTSNKEATVIEKRI